MKPTLLVFTSTYPRWENDTDPPFVHELSKRLVRDFNVHVLTPHYTDSKTLEVYEGVTIHRYRYFFNTYEKLAGATGILPTLKNQKLYYFLVPLLLVCGLLTMARLAVRLKPSLIHAHWLIPQGFITAIVASLFHIPYIITAHGADLFALNGGVFKWAKSFAMNRAAKVMVVSNMMLDKVNNDFSFRGETLVLPMGVDSEKFNTHKRKSSYWQEENELNLNIAFVGRLSEKKGVKYLLEAASRLKDAHCDYFLQIVGDGELRTELQKTIEELALEKHVKFLGPKPNTELPEFYVRADIFVGPSIETADGDTEGLGLTFIEAGMSGCLLIGTSVGGISDIVRNGKTGILVRPEDGQAIADAILSARKNKKKMAEILANCQNHCRKQYSWESIALRYSAHMLALVPH